MTDRKSGNLTNIPACTLESYRRWCQELWGQHPGSVFQQVSDNVHKAWVGVGQAYAPQPNSIFAAAKLLRDTSVPTGLAPQNGEPQQPTGGGEDPPAAGKDESL